MLRVCVLEDQRPVADGHWMDSRFAILLDALRILLALLIDGNIAQRISPSVRPTTNFVTT